MKVFDIVLRDLRSAVRSRFAIGMMIVAPLTMTGLIYLAFGGFRSPGKKASLPVTAVGVVNLDRAVAGQEGFGKILLRILQGDDLAGMLKTQEYKSEAAARMALDRQEIGVAVIIPADFSNSVMTPAGHSTVRVVRDPTRTLGPQVVEGVVQQFLDGFSGVRITDEIMGGVDPARKSEAEQAYVRWAMAQGESKALGVRPPAADGKEADALKIMFGRTMVGMLVFFVFYTGAFMAMTILQEEEDGTLARLFTTPTARAAVLGGKFLAVLFIVTGQSLVLLGASALAFGIRWGSATSVPLALLGLVVCASGFGIFLMSLVKNTRQTGPVLGGVLSVMGMLGGLFTTSVPNMPAAFSRVALAMPQGWALRVWTLSLTGHGARDILGPAGLLFAIGAVCFVIGVARARRRFA